MSEDESDRQVNWSSFFKTLVLFLILGLFLRIGFEIPLISLSFLIIGIFISFFFAVPPSEDNSKGKSVGVQKRVNEKEGQKVKRGSKTVTQSEENDLVGEVIKYYGLANKEGGVARLKVDEPIVVGDLIKFSSSQMNFTQEIDEIRAEGTKTKEVALEGEVSIRVDSRVEVGAELFLVSKDDRPTDVKNRILEERNNQENSSSRSTANDDNNKVTEKSTHLENERKSQDKSEKIKEAEDSSKEEGVGKVQNYMG